MKMYEVFRRQVDGFHHKVVVKGLHIWEYAMDSSFVYLKFFIYTYVCTFI